MKVLRPPGRHVDFGQLRRWWVHRPLVKSDPLEIDALHAFSAGLRVGDLVTVSGNSRPGTYRVTEVRSDTWITHLRWHGFPWLSFALLFTLLAAALAVASWLAP